MIKRIISRIQNLFLVGLLKKVDDSTKLQLVRVMLDSNDDHIDVERLQQYGITSNPPTDSETLVLNISGSNDKSFVIVCESGEYRLKNLDNGEVCLYSMYQQQIHLKKDGSITISANTINNGNGTDFVALASKVDLLWQTLYTIFSSWAPVYEASLKSSFLAAYGAGPQSTASTNLKAD